MLKVVRDGQMLYEAKVLICLICFFVCEQWHGGEYLDRIFSVGAKLDYKTRYRLMEMVVGCSSLATL